VDVVVSSLGNAKSLRGGTLLMTPLKGVDNQVYALAQGNLLISGAGAQGGGSRVQVNHLNSGRITHGAIIEREVPADFASGNTLNLQLNEDDFTVAQQISDEINRRFGGGTARAGRWPQRCGSTCRATAPARCASWPTCRISPFARRWAYRDAKVILNSRTGTVVMNRNVVLDSCAIAQGDLTVEVNRSYDVSQPDTPLGGGQTTVTPNTDISMREQGGSLQQVKSSANLNSVVRALNSLGATPNDLMAILQAMQNAGCLRAKLEIN
jgi:flagellar P-ring protein precursor FlgI